MSPSEPAGASVVEGGVHTPRPLRFSQRPARAMRRAACLVNKTPAEELGLGGLAVWSCGFGGRFIIYSHPGICGCDGANIVHRNDRRLPGAGTPHISAAKFCAGAISRLISLGRDFDRTRPKSRQRGLTP
jgi:hypothetical protein